MDASSAEIRRFIEVYTDEVWNRRNPAAMHNFYRLDYIHHDVSRPDVRSLDDYQTWAKALITAFPDLVVRIEDIIVEGNKAVKRWVVSGTHRGDLAGVPPTGKKVMFSGVSAYRIQDGKIAESWYLYDLFGLLQQMR